MEDARWVDRDVAPPQRPARTSADHGEHVDAIRTLNEHGSRPEAVTLGADVSAEGQRSCDCRRRLQSFAKRCGSVRGDCAFG